MRHTAARCGGTAGLGIVVAVSKNVGHFDLARRFIKVDHAGEHGAVGIYSGQMFIARLTAPDLVAELAEFCEHERRHREVFRSQLVARGWRRCRSC